MPTMNSLMPINLFYLKVLVLFPNLTISIGTISFDIVNMFPSIDVSGLQAISEILENRETNFPPAECILEGLKLCLECNNSAFNEKFYLQKDGTTMGPHMPCSYSDIAIYRFDLKALSYTCKVLCWKRFRDDIFAL